MCSCSSPCCKFRVPGQAWVFWCWASGWGQWSGVPASSWLLALWWCRHLMHGGAGNLGTILLDLSDPYCTHWYAAHQYSIFMFCVDLLYIHWYCKMKARIDHNASYCVLIHLNYMFRTYIYIYLGKLYRPHCDLTGIMVSKGNHPHMALIQVSEIL